MLFLLLLFFLSFPNFFSAVQPQRQVKWAEEKKRDTFSLRLVFHFVPVERGGWILDSKKRNLKKIKTTFHRRWASSSDSYSIAGHHLRLVISRAKWLLNRKIFGLLVIPSIFRQWLQTVLWGLLPFTFFHSNSFFRFIVPPTTTAAPCAAIFFRQISSRYVSSIVGQTAQFPSDAAVCHPSKGRYVEK